MYKPTIGCLSAGSLITVCSVLTVVDYNLRSGDVETVQENLTEGLELGVQLEH